MRKAGHVEKKKKNLQSNEVVCSTTLAWCEIRTTLSLTPSDIDTECLTADTHSPVRSLCLSTTSGYSGPGRDSGFGFSACTKATQDFCNNIARHGCLQPRETFAGK